MLWQAQHLSFKVDSNKIVSQFAQNCFHVSIFEALIYDNLKIWAFYVAEKHFSDFSIHEVLETRELINFEFRKLHKLKCLRNKF